MWQLFESLDEDKQQKLGIVDSIPLSSDVPPKIQSLVLFLRQSKEITEG